MENDDKLLLSVFPREVWQLALQNVEKVATYQKICDSSPFFARLSSPYHIKIRMLFPKVLPFIVDYLKDNSVKYEDGNRYDYDLHKYVIRLRKICRDWKNGVDDLLQSFCQGSIFEDETEKVNIWDQPYAWFLGFEVDEEFQYFQEDFDNLHLASNANPIPSRALFIRFDEETVEQERFLEKYGHHVWFCALNVHDISLCTREEYMNERYTWVCDVVKQLPNLKLLCIVALTDDGNVEWPAFEAESDSEDEDNDMTENLSSMPTLEKLQFLYVRNLEDPIAIALLKSNPQITLLQTSRTNIGKLLEFDLRNLTDLQVNLPPYGLDIAEKELQILKQSPSTWPLKKLKICENQYSKASWKTLFEAVSKFGGTLKELEITLPEPPSYDNSLQLVLPHLEKLYVIADVYVTIDFILPTKNSLRELSLTVWKSKIFSDKRCGVIGENKNKIQLFKFRRQLWRSNIWELFPKLRKTRIETSVKKGWISCHRTERDGFAGTSMTTRSSGKIVSHV